MLRTRDAEAIGEAGTFQRKQASDLAEKFKTLSANVEALRNVYTGVEADSNISVFQIGIDNFKNVIEKINLYGEYQEKVFKHDAANEEKAMKDVNALLSESFVGGNENQNVTLSNIDTEIIGGDSNA